MDEKQQLIEQLLEEGYDDPEVIEAVVHERLGNKHQQQPPVVAKPNDPTMLPGHGKTKTVGAEDFMPGVLDGIKGRVGEFLQPLAEQQKRDTAAEDAYFKTGQVTPLEEQYPGPPKGALTSALTYPVTGAAQVITDLGEGTREGQGKAMVDAAAYLPVLLGMRKGVTKPIAEGATGKIKSVARAVASEQGGRYASAAQKGMFPFLFEGVRHLAEHIAGDPAEAPEPTPSSPATPKASVGEGHVAPSTETSMRSGAPMPQEPVPFVMHTQERPPAPQPPPSRTGTGFGGAGMPQEPVPFVMHVPNEPIQPTPPSRTGTGFTSASPEGPTSPTGSGFSATREATPPKPPTPPTPRPERTGTGAETEPVNGPTSPNGQGFKMNVKTPPKPPAAETAKAPEPPPTKAPEPPKTEPTTDRPPSRSKRGSQVDGLSEADIDSRAAARGVSRETIIAEEMAELRKRAERHMEKFKANGAKPESILKQLMIYREKFGADFGKDIK